MPHRPFAKPLAAQSVTWAYSGPGPTDEPGRWKIHTSLASSTCQPHVTAFGVPGVGAAMPRFSNCAAERARNEKHDQPDHDCRNTRAVDVREVDSW